MRTCTSLAPAARTILTIFRLVVPRTIESSTRMTRLPSRILLTGFSFTFTPKCRIDDCGWMKVKLNPVKSILEGRRVILVDDSIVRGTTSRKIVRMVRAAGAREVHLRISCPPTISPCFYGIDTPSKAELIAATHTIDQIREYV